MREDKDYLDILLEPIRRSIEYQPKLGQGGKAIASEAEFQSLYSNDPFYHWLGLDVPEVYVAHRVAGGITSLYRQVGIGCERLIRAVCKDALQIQEEADLEWSYKVQESDTAREIHLDLRVVLDKVSALKARERVKEWIDRVRNNRDIKAQLEGIVFEVRQGYKSKDSKRQNADLRTAARAFQSSYLPCMLVLSQQIDTDVKRRYEDGGWVVLIGNRDPDTTKSTYSFMREVIGYDLASFFERSAEELREVIRQVIQALMRKEAESG